MGTWTTNGLRPRFAALTLALVVLAAGCGDDEDEAETPAPTPVEEAPAAAAGPMLDEQGTLAEGDSADARGVYDRFFVDVEAGDQLVVTLTSDAFDPIVEVTPPNQGMLVNDDYQGDLTRSQLELVASQAGAMKVEVRSYGAGTGAYALQVARTGEGGPAPTVAVLRAGSTVAGELTASDPSLSGGERFDSYVVQAEGPVRVSVSGEGAASVQGSLVGPDGLPIEADADAFEGPRAGTYRLQVIGAEGVSYRVRVQEGGGVASPLFARAHHQFNRILERITGGGSTDATDDTPPPVAAAPPAGAAAGAADAPAPRALPIRVGDRLNGTLAATDGRLPSGEFFDLYELVVGSPGGDVAIDLESSAFDCFVRVDGPNGQHWENDDHAGTLNSRVMLSLRDPGTYRITTTSYRAGETGAYELKVLSQRDAALTAAGAAPAPAGPSRTVPGALAEGDTQLGSGEFVDEHVFEWPVGARVHLEARSTEFDTYLIVRAPGGDQQDNDDMRPGESLNAGLDLQVTEAGSWRVLVTSYQPGKTGSYELVVQGAGEQEGAPSAPSGAPTGPPAGTPPSPPPPAGAPRVIEGELAQGDGQLSSGEFRDSVPMTFTPRSAVSIRLESSDFDTYLIVTPPSGVQEDNDDLEPGNLNSGIDIPVAEPGNYNIVVTSYRPGETGRYRLTVTEGASVVDPAPAPPSGDGSQPPASSGGGRVWGLFAGITDYPGSSNDLPECANDARKLAEAVRSQGNMPEDQEFLFTDSQATTENIRSAMRTIGSRIQPDDVFVFFYSGHGGQTESSEDPQELDERDEYMFVYDGQLMDDELGQLFDGIEARVALIAIDACFAGGFAKDVITRRGRVGMFSSEEDVTSAVAGRFQAGGYLSHFLRLGISGEGDNDPRNNILTVGELTHYTWRQFGQHASDVRMSMGYQHLVVDRGAVRTNEVLWAVRR